MHLRMGLCSGGFFAFGFALPYKMILIFFSGVLSRQLLRMRPAMYTQETQSENMAVVCLKCLRIQNIRSYSSGVPRCYRNELSLAARKWNVSGIIENCLVEPLPSPFPEKKIWSIIYLLIWINILQLKQTATV